MEQPMVRRHGRRRRRRLPGVGQGQDVLTVTPHCCPCEALRAQRRSNQNKQPHFNQHTERKTAVGSSPVSDVVGK